MQKRVSFARALITIPASRLASNPLLRIDLNDRGLRSGACTRHRMI